MGVLVGMVLGGTQAISRSLMGQFTPKSMTGEFFGFYAISGKFASVLGPLVFGLITHLTGTIRYGVLAIGPFFVAGMILLARVDERAGLEQAESAVSSSADPE